MKYLCPCCGYRTLDEEPPGSYALCPVCCWEDDLLQFCEPEREHGANPVSLQQAKKNFAEFGAIDRNSLPSARGPLPIEMLI